MPQNKVWSQQDDLQFAADFQNRNGKDGRLNNWSKHNGCDSLAGVD